MKRFIISIAAVFILTAVLLITIWSVNKGDPATDSAEPSLEESSTEPSSAEEAEDSLFFQSSEDSFAERRETGPLFSPYKDIVEGGVYKLVTTRQKRFGGNSVPVKTTTYYGDGFINVIEEEGHATATETFINSHGVYCFDSSSGQVHYMPDLVVETDSILTEGLNFLETGEANVGLATFTYERYEDADGRIIDYLFAGSELKRMKLYEGEDYELVSLELYADISGARTELPQE